MQSKRMYAVIGSLEFLEEKRGIVMAPSATAVSQLLDTLEEEDYKTAICFIEYLSDSRKKIRAEKSKKTLKEIQGMFTDDKGWDSEKSMIEEMAAFRKKRMGL